MTRSYAAMRGNHSSYTIAIACELDMDPDSDGKPAPERSGADTLFPWLSSSTVYVGRCSPENGNPQIITAIWKPNFPGEGGRAITTTLHYVFACTHHLERFFHRGAERRPTPIQARIASNTIIPLLSYCSGLVKTW